MVHILLSFYYNSPAFQCVKFQQLDNVARKKKKRKNPGNHNALTQLKFIAGSYHGSVQVRWLFGGEFQAGISRVAGLSSSWHSCLHREHLEGSLVHFIAGVGVAPSLCSESRQNRYPCMKAWGLTSFLLCAWTRNSGW